jgi:hypothetical protein
MLRTRQVRVGKDNQRAFPTADGGLVSEWLATQPYGARVAAEFQRRLRAIPIMSGCRLWVKRVIMTMRRPLPVLPDKQTFSESVGMSQTCQERNQTSSALSRTTVFRGVKHFTVPH